MWPNRSDEAASTAADDDYIRVETCTEPCGLTAPTRQQVLQLMMTRLVDIKYKKLYNWIYIVTVNVMVYFIYWKATK